MAGIGILGLASVGFALNNTMYWMGKLQKELTDPMQVEGARTDGDRVGSSSYGRPIPLIFGERNRLAGNLIWAGPLVERATTTTSGGKGGGSPEVQTTNYSYSRSYAFLLGEEIENLSRIWANGKLIFSQNSVTTIPDAGQTFTGGNGLLYSAIRVYRGSATQNPDPSIEAALGSGNASAYRYSSYVVIDTLQLADFGNGTPNIEFEISGPAATTGGIVADVCVRAGLEADEYRIDSSLTDAVDGFIISKQADAISATEPLRTVFAFDAAEDAGTISFTARGRGMVAAIETSDMAASQGIGSEQKTPLETNREPEFKLPKSATLTFIDHARDYQENTQPSVRNEGGAETKLNVKIDVTMTPSLARKVVDRLLWEPWTQRMTATISVTDKYQFLKPAHVVALPVAGAWAPYRITEKTRGANGLIQLDMTMDDPFIYDGATTAEDAEIPVNDVIEAGDTFAMAINLPIIHPSESASAFSYVISADSAGWRGGQMMRSTDAGTTWSTLAGTGRRNIVGTVATATPAAATADVWDRSAIITVVLLYSGHQLESLPEIDVINGRNACWIGAADGSRGEIIQFATATLINSNPRTYELSDLLRGRRATEHEMSLHGSNEVFVFFEAGAMNSADYTITDWDRAREYKGVSVLQAESDVIDTQEFVNLGEKARPRAPVHGRGSRDGSGDVVVTWMRRTRHFSPGIGYGAVSMDEQTESYEIDVYDGVAVVRTISSTSTSATYTSAQQTADGLTPGDPVDIRIYQISSTRGRGHAGVFTV